MKSFLSRKPATTTPSSGGGVSPVCQTTFNNQSQRTPASAKHKPKKGSISHFFSGVSPRSNTVTNSQVHGTEGVSPQSNTLKNKLSPRVNTLSRTVDPTLLETPKSSKISLTVTESQHLLETPKSSKIPLTVTESQHLFSQSFANRSLQSQSWTNTSLVEMKRGNGGETFVDESRTAGSKDVSATETYRC